MWKSSQLWRCLTHILCTKFRFILLLNIGFVRNLVHICQLWSSRKWFPNDIAFARGTNVEMIRGWKLWMECVKMLLTFMCATSNFTRDWSVFRVWPLLWRDENFKQVDRLGASQLLPTLVLCSSRSLDDFCALRCFSILICVENSESILLDN